MSVLVLVQSPEHRKGRKGIFSMLTGVMINFFKCLLGGWRHSSESYVAPLVITSCCPEDTQKNVLPLMLPHKTARLMSIAGLMHFKWTHVLTFLKFPLKGDNIVWKSCQSKISSMYWTFLPKVCYCAPYFKVQTSIQQLMNYYLELYANKFVRESHAPHFLLDMKAWSHWQIQEI